MITWRLLELNVVLYKLTHTYLLQWVHNITQRVWNYFKIIYVVRLDCYKIPRIPP